mmetsp:Transcript_12902/g.16987  ORF Transcript_12902/g.16987 Transcript_12902/m.16987 type:complete len:104 (-) Transcript_12902:171-482(-)
MIRCRCCTGRPALMRPSQHPHHVSDGNDGEALSKDQQQTTSGNRSFNHFEDECSWKSTLVGRATSSASSDPTHSPDSDPRRTTPKSGGTPVDSSIIALEDISQ